MASAGVEGKIGKAPDYRPRAHPSDARRGVRDLISLPNEATATILPVTCGGAPDR